VKPTTVKPTTVKPTTVKPTTVKPATAVETSAVETSAATMRPSVGEIWQAERDNTQQSSRSGAQSSSYPGLRPVFP
jgi:hypothetical protein